MTVACTTRKISDYILWGRFAILVDGKRSSLRKKPRKERNPHWTQPPNNKAKLLNISSKWHIRIFDNIAHDMVI